MRRSLGRKGDFAGARGLWVAEPSVLRWTLVGVLVLGAGLRLAHVDQPMRYDEAAMYLKFASRSLATVLTDYSVPNNHVFHTLLVWLTTRALGNAPWVIRLPTLVAGILVLPATYLAARELDDHAAGIAATALAAGLPALILYSTNARGYVIVSLASLVLLVIGSGIIDGDDTIAAWCAFGGVAAIGMFTIPVMLYPAGGIGLWIVVEKVRTGGARAVAGTAPRLLGGVAVAGLLTLACYSGVIVRSGVHSLVSNRFVTPLGWGDFVKALPAFFLDLRNVLGLGIPRVLGACLAVAVAASFASKGPVRQRLVSLAVAMLVWCVLVLLATKRPPPARVWLFLTPIACIYAGIGIAVMIRTLAAFLRRPAYEGMFIAVASLGVSGIVAARVVVTHIVLRSEETDYYGLREARDIARFLLPTLRSGDRIVALGTTGLPLDYYLLSLGKRRLATFDSVQSPNRVFVIVNARHRQTLASVEGRRPDVSWTTLRTPAVAHTFGEAAIYETYAISAAPDDR